MGLRCKECGSEEHVKNGFMRGKQRYRCKACGLSFTDTPLPGKPLAMKVTAVLLYVSGLSMMNGSAVHHRQAAGRLHPDHPGVDRAVRQGLCPEARARRPCPSAASGCRPLGTG
jgi:transposase-like protein